jgi:cell pole-organizing protein PopZ
MVQSGSAQREPSMEEILASIRRIIEDSDTVRPPEDETPPEMADDAERGEVEAFKAELEAPSVVHAAPSMADIQASIPAQPAAPEVRPMAEVTPFRSEPAPAAATFEDDFETHEVPEPVSVADDFAADLDSDLSADEEIVQEVAQPAFLRQSQPEQTAVSRSSIISEQAGRQVAAAFEELSEAFAASRKRSFDEMAEDMLRPMLQDWLDNNLPMLVEKLVREEIERVARGGQG